MDADNCCSRLQDYYRGNPRTLARGREGSARALRSIYMRSAEFAGACFPRRSKRPETCSGLMGIPLGRICVDVHLLELHSLYFLVCLNMLHALNMLIACLDCSKSLCVRCVTSNRLWKFGLGDVIVHFCGVELSPCR